MRIGINQPYFFPYLGHFSIIKNTDCFILLDTAQFVKQSWMIRNRVLTPEGGWEYIRVPVASHSQKDMIKDVKIDNSKDWRNKLIRYLEHYKKKAPYYTETVETVTTALDIETDSIAKLNQNILKTICGYLGINRDISIFSELGLEIEKPMAPDEWPLNICKAIGNVDEYWNPEGGAEFYDKTKFTDAGIKIAFLKINLKEYPQAGGEFIPGLSIIDVMMFNKPTEIDKMLDDYILL